MFCQIKWNWFLVILVIGSCFAFDNHLIATEANIEIVGDEAITIRDCPLPAFLKNNLKNALIVEHIYCTIEENTLVISGHVRDLTHMVFAEVEVEGTLVDTQGNILAKADCIVTPKIIMGTKHHKVGYFTIRLPHSPKAKKVVLSLTSEKRERESGIE